MRLLPAIFGVVFTCINLASAAPQYTQAKQAVDKVKKAEKDLAKKLSGLSVSDKSKLKAAVRGTDSDGDGVSDEVELGLGSNLCSNDSDSDGIDDGQDDYEKNADQNGDGQRDGHDGQGAEAKGKITSFNDPVLMISGKSFTVTPDTAFKGSGFGKDGLKVGVCVEIEGHIVSGTNIADKIKQDDGC